MSFFFLLLFLFICSGFYLFFILFFLQGYLTVSNKQLFSYSHTTPSSFHLQQPLNFIFLRQVRVPSIHVLASVLAWSSAVVNPFVYAVTNRQYRAAYRKLFCGHRSKPGRSSNSHSKSNSSRTFVTEFQYHASSGHVTSPVLVPNPTADA